MKIHRFNLIASAIICAVVSSLTVRALRQLWIIPVSFIGALAVMFLVSWFGIAVVSLTINFKKTYDAPSKFYSKFFNMAYDYLYTLAGARIEVSGLELVPDDRPFIIVSNHRSNFDNMIESNVLKKYPIAYISKPANFKIPMGRRFMKRCCYLSISRESPLQALKTVNQAIDLIKSGVTSIGIYPEGHRSKSREMGEFKLGYIRIAANAGCPIVVSTITGTEKIHKRFPFRTTKVHFSILGVVEPEEIQSSKPKELSDKIKNMMEENLIEQGEIKDDARTLQFCIG